MGREGWGGLRDFFATSQDDTHKPQADVRLHQGDPRRAAWMIRHHRASYEDEALLPDVLDLLGLVFPSFREQECAARALGLRWEACCTPFVYRVDDRIVAHVGVLEMPLLVDGERIPVASVHGVATHPDHRGKGYFRSLMEELLPWCEHRYETMHLCTDNPEYFTAFGFRPLQEHHFVTETATRPDPTIATEPLGDPARLRGLLERRSPVSRRFGVADRDVFLFNEARRPFRYCPDLDAVLVYDVVDETLRLWDIVSPRIPTLENLLAAIPERFLRIEAHFASDLLDPSAFTPVADPGEEDVLMARGPYPVEGLPFKLPSTARC